MKNWNNEAEAREYIKNLVGEYYNDFKKQTLSVGRKYAYLPSKLKCSKKDKVRALCLILMPALLPKLLFFRRKIYGVNIRN